MTQDGAATLVAYATETAIAGLPPAEQTSIALTASRDPETRCTHTIAVGETLFALAQSYNTTVEQFRTLNQLTGNDLFVGQELFVPECYHPERDDLDAASFGYTCQNLFDSMVVRSTSRAVGCRAVDIDLIDKHPALSSGMIAAMDILGYVGPGVEVCFRNIGDLVFLNPATNPPTPNKLQSYSNAAGMTCGEVNEIGTLVLVTVITEQDTFLELTTCQVTTTQTLRLRNGVGSSAVVGLVPYNVTLDSSARTNNWFRVTFLGTQGWISANYVLEDGICQ